MFDYLQQFNKLPSDLRQQVSSPVAMAKLSAIEKKYGLDLAMVVMRVMIKTLLIKDMPTFFVSEFNLAPQQAQNLAQDLKKDIFSVVAGYVGLNNELRNFDLYQDIDLIIKEASLSVASEFLVERLKKILATYLKGVRSRIDTREALAKSADAGGLGLSIQEIDRLFKICDSQRIKYQDLGLKTVPSLQSSKRLEAIINGSFGQNPTIGQKSLSTSTAIPEYNLKQALASGETKKIEAPVAKVPLPLLTPNKAINVSTKLSSDTAEKTETIKPIALVPPVAVPKPTVLVPPIAVPKPVETIKPVSAEKINQVVDFNQKKEELKKNIVIDEKIVEAVQQEGNTPNKIVPNTTGPGVVRKPESTGLFKKLFTESQKQVPAGVIKFATEADVQAIKPILSRASVNSNEKVKMQDVKVVPKIMGPIEELQFLDLINFRRLGKTPEEITTKIFTKVKMLERDGYEKMIVGITAWKKSPVSRLYLRIAQEAVVAGVTLQQAISARQTQNQEYLDMNEISAIIKLNSRLVF